MTLDNFPLKTTEPKYTECTPIDPIPEGVPRPLWSVMIPTYNRTRYLEEALKSVLEQDPGLDQMQIEVIDNCSTEADPEAVVRRIGQNRVSFYRQPNNVGITANLTTCIKRARGHLVHILHDDDAVMPGFYSHLQQAFEKEPTIGSACCRCVRVKEYSQQFLDELQRSTPGILSNWLERVAVKNRIQAPAIVVRRSVYEKLGGFHPELCQNLDWEMAQRIAAHYPVWYDPQVLACYREHSDSESSSSIRSGKNLVDMRRAIEISHAYLPNTIADNLSKKAREDCALHGLNTARRALARGDKFAATNQITEALKSSFSLRVVGTLALFPILVPMSVVKRYVYKQPRSQ